MGGSKHTVETQARVMILSFPWYDEVASTTPLGYNAISGDRTTFMDTPYLVAINRLPPHCKREEYCKGNGSKSSPFHPG
jgi:hypothetical protein